MHSMPLAQWLSEFDPEVIGSSDVADNDLRRLATLNLIGRFRTHDLTAVQIWRTGLDVNGFRYTGAEHDLRPLLKERGPDTEDVLECVVKLVSEWRIVELSDELADLILDETAPAHARISAGYAITKFGTPHSRSRPKPLLTGGANDPDDEFRGLALRANWPNQLTALELFPLVTPPRRRLFMGAYAHFLMELDRSTFAADGHLLEALDWLRGFFRQCGDFQGIERLAGRVARAAARELHDARVAQRTAALLIAVANQHHESPLGSRRSPRSDRFAADDGPPPWTTPGRRALVDALVCSGPATDVWWVAYDTDGLVDDDDFRWLLQRATDQNLSLERRTLYADVARVIAWDARSDNVDAWLSVRTIEPIASKLPGSLYVKLGSEEAAEAKKWHRQLRQPERTPKRRRVKPAPAERVLATLAKAETDDPAYFFAVCRELTLEEFSTHYEFERFVTRTPGWQAADTNVRQRILSSAKRVLQAPSDDPENVRSEPLTSIKGGHALAVWLLLDQEPDWLGTLDNAWWTRWAWYFVRELHPGLHGEEEEPKRRLLELLCRRAAAGVRAAILELATSDAEGAAHALSAVLDLSRDSTDATLDRELMDAVGAARVPAERISDVAKFVLARTDGVALPTLVALLQPSSQERSDARAIQAAAALMTHVTRHGWDHVKEFLNTRRDLVQAVLGEVFHGERFLSLESKDAGLGAMTPEQIGELLCLLLETFPPESDPRHDDAHWVTPDDAARTARSHLISWLGGQNTADAVSALRHVEARHGTRYPWLRNARVTAERRFRLAQWRPVEPKVVGELLEAQEKRLIRSDVDALDAIEAAIEEYARHLRTDRLGDLDDFWNRPSGARPSPKEEERASEKIANAIRGYLKDYALTVDREVQVFRRLTPSDAGGAPGSKPDVLCRVPARGTVTDTPIAVPLEVKLSFNPEARGSLAGQLAGRYIPQVAATGGVFVLVWLDATGLSKGHRPLWKSLEAAKVELRAVAAEHKASITTADDVRVAFVDASLPLASPSGVRRRRPKGRAKQKPLARNRDSASQPKTTEPGPRPRPSKPTTSTRLRVKSESKKAGTDTRRRR